MEDALLVEFPQLVGVDAETRQCLFLIGLSILANLVVLDNIGLLIRADDPQPVPQLMLLQELLGQVLQVALGNLSISRLEDNLVGITGDGDSGLSEIVGTAVDLDAVGKVLLKRRHVENLVGDGSRAVNDELAGQFHLLLLSIENQKKEHGRDEISIRKRVI